MVVNKGFIPPLQGGCIAFWCRL